MCPDPGDEAGEHIRGVSSFPPPRGGQPDWRSEVMERHYRGDAPLAAGRADAAVVVKRRDGELTLGGFDSTPLE